MAAYNKYENFVEDVGDAVHSFKAAGHTLKLMLSNSAPNAATHEVRADSSELGGGGGYTSGGEDTQNDASRSGGTLTVTAVDIVWTATTGFGPFRYPILYNDTPGAPADPLIAYWDYASGVTLAAAETFTADFGASLFTFA